MAVPDRVELDLADRGQRVVELDDGAAAGGQQAGDGRDAGVEVGQVGEPVDVDQQVRRARQPVRRAARGGRVVRGRAVAGRLGVRLDDAVAVLAQRLGPPGHRLEHRGLDPPPAQRRGDVAAVAGQVHDPGAGSEEPVGLELVDEALDMGTHRRRRGPRGRAHEVLLGRRVAQQLEQPAGGAPAEDQGPRRPGVRGGGLGERVRARLRAEVEDDVGRRGMAGATGAGGHWQVSIVRGRSRRAAHGVGAPIIARLRRRRTWAARRPARIRRGDAPAVHADTGLVHSRSRPLGAESAVRCGPVGSSGDLPPAAGTPIVPWRVAPRHHMLGVDNRIGEDPCPRKGTPVARRGRKATGLTAS